MSERTGLCKVRRTVKFFPPLRTLPSTFPTPENFMHILSQLVGVSFRGAGIKALVQSLETGTEFTLEADPENPYDSNAVKVLYTDDNDETQFIGFLSKESNAETAEHLGNGLKVKCELLDMA